ncbi:MAG TPA: MmcQ/YjbR family DNA-binding protein [Chitinophagaceae bacterium]|nr:MmcQ/YjbR family DNA-binding protein [Chitinophagaceae bacterium]
MDAEEIRLYVQVKPQAEECFPFGENTLVFKVRGKIFLLVSLDSQPLQFNAKCDPEKAILLREQYPSVIPGYHMNKKHWNTIYLDGSLSKRQILELIDESYNLVAPKKRKKTA